MLLRVWERFMSLSLRGRCCEVEADVLNVISIDVNIKDTC